MCLILSVTALYTSAFAGFVTYQQAANQARVGLILSQILSQNICVIRLFIPNDANVQWLFKTHFTVAYQRGQSWLSMQLQFSDIHSGGLQLVWQS